MNHFPFPSNFHPEMIGGSDCYHEARRPHWLTVHVQSRKYSHIQAYVETRTDDARQRAGRIATHEQPARPNWITLAPGAS